MVLTVGACTTVMLAVLLVPPVPVSVELTAPVVVMFTLMLQDPPAATVPPLRPTVVPPAVAEKVPPQALDALGGLDTCKPAGRLSVNASPVRANAEFGLLMVNVRVVALPN